MPTLKSLREEILAIRKKNKPALSTLDKEGLIKLLAELKAGAKPPAPAPPAPAPPPPPPPPQPAAAPALDNKPTQEAIDRAIENFGGWIWRRWDNYWYKGFYRNRANHTTEVDIQKVNDDAPQFWAELKPLYGKTFQAGFYVKGESKPRIISVYFNDNPKDKDRGTIHIILNYDGIKTKDEAYQIVEDNLKHVPPKHFKLTGDSGERYVAPVPDEAKIKARDEEEKRDKLKREDVLISYQKNTLADLKKKKRELKKAKMDIEDKISVATINAHLAQNSRDVMAMMLRAT
jgi:hypothetical protein